MSALEICREKYHRLELKIVRLQAENEKFKRALRTAQNRFTDPGFNCVWKNAAEDIERILKEKP